ncbi:hypothetical protein GP486_007661 [Trichoglossum hirsutum]|uniref:Pisatin demethylase n=1 Tax=Trichoglossum hirsutum TaxID=265104 RepID=A0A9P8IF38_9PEZI|nr:hypothetical protein GP486_007661 [Trichoglossum hirsutum]
MLWLVKSVVRRNMYEDFGAACEEYGSIVRIGSNILITDSPEIAFRMSAVRSKYHRSDQYNAGRMDPTRNNLFSELDETRHMELRTKMATGYSGKENVHLEESIDNRILDLVKLIETKYLSAGSHMRAFDLARKAQFLTLDVITDVAFGESFGNINADEDVHGYIDAIERMLLPSLWLQVFPSLVRLLAIPWIGRMVLPSSGDHIGVGKAMGVAKKVVAERYGPDRKVRGDMLGSFIRHGLTQEEAESESLLQMCLPVFHYEICHAWQANVSTIHSVAGAETTATAIRTTLLHIITQPRVYSALQAEIDNAARANHISSPIRDAEARQLPYLIACIREGLRTLPPVPNLLAKTVPPGGDTLDGKFVPSGTNIMLSMCGVMRNKSIFGEDVGVFRPERWLEADGQMIQQMEKTVDLVFGYGKYQCLGSTIAWIELRKVLVEVRKRGPLLSEGGS